MLPTRLSEMKFDELSVELLKVCGPVIQVAEKIQVLKDLSRIC